MRAPFRILLPVAVAAALCLFSAAADRPGARRQVLAPTSPMLIVNEDLQGPGLSEISSFNIQGAQLNYSTTLVTAGYGIGGGFFGTQRLSSVPSLSAACVYVADSGTNDISTVSIPALELIDSFTGSDTDDGSSNGIGMAVNQNFLYAGYTTSGTI